MTKEVKISTLGMNCPKPLIETRKALRKMNAGTIVRLEAGRWKTIALPHP